MVYVFDTNSFRVLGNYYPKQFRTFWGKFDQYVAEHKVISVREVYRELEGMLPDDSHLANWVKTHRDIFLPPSGDETECVRKILSVKHFQQLIKKRNILQGMPVADPWIIAAASIEGRCVVTEEKEQPNAAKIPNVCNHFNILCTNLEGFMENENWVF